MKNRRFRAIGYSFATITIATVSIGMARLTSGMNTPGLSLCALSDGELTQLTVDVFMKGLETQSQYLLECSADSSLRQYINGLMGLLRMKSVSAFGRVPTSTSGVALAFEAEESDTASADTLTTKYAIRLFAADSCVYRDSSTCLLTRMESGWRVTQMSNLDSLGGIPFLVES